MKKINIAVFVLYLITGVLVNSCGNKRSPGLAYMPDMGESRAFEAYAMHDSLLFTTDVDKRGGNMIFYNSMPVPGTMERGEIYPYTMPNDSIGYKMSGNVKNPLINPLDSSGMLEAGRLYNINCAICHGDKGGGNGPLATAGHVGGVANLTLPNYVSMADGTMFHAVTYGKGVMGSYASQLNRKQRWEVIKYIRTLQNPEDSTATDSTATKKVADSASVIKK